jgi:hypothetical protein
MYSIGAITQHMFELQVFLAITMSIIVDMTSGQRDFTWSTIRLNDEKQHMFVGQCTIFSL